MSILSLAQLKSLAQQVGLSGNAANIAAAIAEAESGGDTQAYNPETAAGAAPGHGSRGLWQVFGTAHPQYDNNSLYDPLTNAKAMYVISSGGTNWNPWSTYQNGQYRQHLSGASSANGTQSAMPVKSGTANNFPMGQCTWWADQHYHDQTFYFVPWNGNAYQWEQGARSSGWQVSTRPPGGIPSIIVMQPNVQGAGGLGHVGVVEKVNNNGTVTVSNMNWNDPNAPVLQTVQGYPIRQTTIKIGAGISFVWATGSGKSTSGNSALDFAGGVVKNFQLAPNASVTQFLIATDTYLQVSNPFDVDTNSIQDSALGISFTDPVKWLVAVANNTASDITAIIIRVILVVLGLWLLLRVIQNFVDFSSSSKNLSQAMPFLQSLMSGGGEAAAAGEAGAAAAPEAALALAAL